MKKFLALYMAPVAAMEKMMKESTPEQMKQGMSEWQDWMTEHADAITDSGGPLGKTKRVTLEEISDTKNDIGGYTIIEADSHEAAAELFQSSPHFKMMPGATVEILEIMPMS